MTGKAGGRHEAEGSVDRGNLKKGREACVLLLPQGRSFCQELPQQKEGTMKQGAIFSFLFMLCMYVYYIQVSGVNAVAPGAGCVKATATAETVEKLPEEVNQARVRLACMSRGCCLVMQASLGKDVVHFDGLGKDHWKDMKLQIWCGADCWVGLPTMYGPASQD